MACPFLSEAPSRRSFARTLAVATLVLALCPQGGLQARQHECGTIGRAGATSGKGKDSLDKAMEAYNQDRRKVCDELCRKRTCDGEKGKPCWSQGDDADATCNLGGEGWVCSD
jgi:hypothetical protein